MAADIAFSILWVMNSRTIRVLFTMSLGILYRDIRQSVALSVLELYSSPSVTNPSRRNAIDLSTDI